MQQGTGAGDTVIVVLHRGGACNLGLEGLRLIAVLWGLAACQKHAWPLLQFAVSSLRKARLSV